MKIGILTHYQVESHGACLQHYAMTKYLQQMGHEPFTLSYSKNLDFSSSSDRQKFGMNMKSIPYYLKECLLKKGPNFVWTMFRKHTLLRNFNKQNFKFAPYSCCGMDTALVGSDEVWSIQLGVNIMMYGHAVDAKKKISYAPSFGQTKISDIERWHCRPLIESGIKAFNAISVRDQGSQAVVQELTGIKPTLVCDPVLLYGFEKEMAAYHPMTNKKYVVVYGYNSNMNEPDRIEDIRKYAAQIGAKVYSVGAFHKWCDKQIACDPIEMLYWFKGAEAVFTDTFHGTISAFLGETPIAVYVRDTNNVKLDHLLQTLGLEDRKVTADRSIFEIMKKQIDFSGLKKAFEPVRKESAAYLFEALDA
jgi:hypothetical protein